MLVGLPAVVVHPQYDVHAGAAAQEFTTGATAQVGPLYPPVQVYLQFGPVWLQG